MLRNKYAICDQRQRVHYFKKYIVIVRVVPDVEALTSANADFTFHYPRIRMLRRIFSKIMYNIRIFTTCIHNY